MADRYAATGTQATMSSSQKTALTNIAATTKRGNIYDVLFSFGGTPADNVANILTRRFTAVGTAGGAVTPALLDPGAAAALITAGEGHSVEPTYTAGSELLDFDLNQRATFRWVAAPGGELKTPATSANGIGFSASSPAYTGAYRVTSHWEE